MRITIFSAIAAMAIASSSMQAITAKADAARSVTTAPAQATRFPAFFAQFRKAVLTGDRNAVAGMTRFPFVDFRPGNYCEGGDKTCKVSKDTLTSGDRAAFLARYDRLFTPAVVAAIRAGRVRGFKPGVDDGDAPGPIQTGEYLLDSANLGDQRVFVPVGGTWRLARIPFYS